MSPHSDASDSFFRPLAGALWTRPAVFFGRIVKLNPGTVAALAFVIGMLGLMEGLGLSILLPLLSLVGVGSGAKIGGPAYAVERAFAALGVPLTLGPVLAVFVAVGLVLVALRALQQYLMVRASERVTSILRRRLFDAASRASWTTLVAGRGGHLMNAIVGEVARIGVVYGNAITAFGLAFSFLVYVVLAAWLSWQLTLFAAVVGGLSMIALRRVYRSSRRFGRYTSDATNRMQEVLNEHIGSAKLIRAMGAGAWSRRIFAAAVEDLAGYLRRNQGNTILVKTSVEPLGLLLVVVLIYLSVEVIRLPAAELMLLMLVVLRITPRLAVLQEMLQRIAGMLPAYEAVAETLARLEAAREPSGDKLFTGLRRAIELSDVSIRHEGTPVLRSVNLVLPAHATVVLVGRSGGGKTTLLDLISGVLAPDEGTVTVDGIPLAALDLASYRSRIAIVPQESAFFHDSIAENLRFAAPAATENEMWAALALAHADDFVRSREAGLQAVIGDQGLRLSGGQRQRLALARALLRKPEILLLDEPTSAIDGETEATIRETLSRLRGSTTIVVVTHRMTLVESADAVYSVVDGTLVLARQVDEATPI